MKKLISKLLCILSIWSVSLSSFAAETDTLGVYVNDVAIKRDHSFDYTKAFNCNNIKEVLLYEDEEGGDSWNESLYDNDGMSILFYSPLKNYVGEDHPDKGKSFPIRFTFEKSDYRISIKGKLVNVGMTQEELFSILPDLRSYYEEYNKDHKSPFTAPYYVDFRLYAQYDGDDMSCPIDFVLNNGKVDTISIDTRQGDELSGWVEFDCCIKKIK